MNLAHLSPSNTASDGGVPSFGLAGAPRRTILQASPGAGNQQVGENDFRGQHRRPPLRHLICSHLSTVRSLWHKTPQAAHVGGLTQNVWTQV